MSDESKKRSRDAEDDDFGPIVMQKKKQMNFRNLYLSMLPDSPSYETSYCHKTEISHVLVQPKAKDIITASVDGYIKFWEKQPTGIDYVKQIRAHTSMFHSSHPLIYVEPITGVAFSPDGTSLVSVGEDNTIRVMDMASRGTILYSSHV